MLIALDWTRPKDPPLSLGHASILAYALQRNIAVSQRSWAVNNSTFKAAEVVDHIISVSAACGNNDGKDLDVAFGVFIWNEFEIQKILKALKTDFNDSFKGRIILGGPQISYTKSSLEKHYPHADVFIRGYAEMAIVDLVTQDVSKNQGTMNINGVHFAGDTDINTKATVDLESLPSPYLTGLIKPQQFIRWETQRGCKFRCSFCQHREPDKALLKTKFFDLNRIYNETKWILDNPTIQDIAVLDPIFNSGSNYIQILQWLYGYTGKLSLQSRIEMVTQDFLKEIQNINKTGNVVLEFGLQTIHKEEQKFIDRGNNMKKVSEILTMTSDRNINTEVSLIFGLPGQTYQSFEQSVNYCIQYKVNKIHAFPLMLLRGTPLYDNKDKLGLKQSHEIVSEFIPRVQDVIPHVVASQSFDYEEWRRMAALAEKLEMEYNVNGNIK